MKRSTYKGMIEKEKDLKRQCLAHFDDFAECHKHEWKYDKKLQAFVDNNDLIQAYKKDGILYYVSLIRH